MGLFDQHHQQILAWLGRKRQQGRVSEFPPQSRTDWPTAPNRNLVLGRDTAVELGHPQDASVSFLIWVDDPQRVRHGRVTLVGPDLPRLRGKRVPFGKAVILGVEGFNDENRYERYRELERRRYEVHLKGYMMRGVSQYMREWSRVSLEALDQGFTFGLLGRALIHEYSRLDYVRSAETIFVTSGREDVIELGTIAGEVTKILAAMHKMAGELSFDCDSCDFADVCADAAELRSMRQSLAKNRADIHG